MKDTLPSAPHVNETGIVNFNTSSELGHWVAYYKTRDKRIYFDSFPRSSNTIQNSKISKKS